MLKALWNALQTLLSLLKYPRHQTSEEIGPEGTEKIPPHQSLNTEPGELWDGNLEDFLPSEPKPTSFFAKSPALVHLIPALLIVLSCFGASLVRWNYPSWGGEVKFQDLSQKHEYWRLVTAIFVHSDLGHLLSNAPLLMVFGFYLNGFFGKLVFPFGALLAGILSNLLTVFFYPPHIGLLGASGMLYAVVAMWLILYLKFENVLAIKQKLLRATGVGLLLLFPTTFQPQTSYLAHVFGFSVGMVIALLLIPHLSRYFVLSLQRNFH